LDLVKAGVQSFSLVDHDRLEVGNIVRHVCGLSDLGRYKTKAVKQLLLDKNPYASVKTFEIKATPETKNQIEEIILSVDLVICATDNRDSRVLINRICVDNGIVCIYGGAFRRAYGGYVLKAIPHETICYQCYIDALPDEAANVEITSEEQAEEIQYSDRPVAIEPGLAIDIAPISLLISRLSILELLKGMDTSISSLYQDYIGAWYFWLNRREAGTQYEKLAPLGFDVHGMHIGRWYSIRINKDEGCPTCGKFLSKVEISQDDINCFKG